MRIQRTFHAPASPHAEHSQRVVDSKRNSRDAARASAATRPKQREGRRFQRDFAGFSTCQRALPRVPQGTRKKLRAPALPRGSSIPSRTNSQDAPRASAPSCRNKERGRRRSCEFSQRHSESVSTRTIPPEGLPATLNIRTVPQRERFDMRDSSRGVHPAYPRRTHPRLRNKIEYNRGGVGSLVYQRGAV